MKPLKKGDAMTLRKQVEEEARSIAFYQGNGWIMQGDQVKLMNMIADALESYAKRCEDAESWRREAEKGIGSDKWLPEEMAKMQEEINSLTHRLEAAEARVKELEGKYEAKCEPERKG